MPPKSSQRTSLGSSQPQPFQAAVTKLCERINEVKTKGGDIKAQSFVNKLKEYLGNYRRLGKILESPIITLVVECLDNDGHNICSRLDPTIFCTVVELVLQTEPCIEGERCLFFLAKSLFDDAQDPESQKVLENRKSKIGQECREQLLGYFIDEGTAPTMRRWAGVLCVQLFSDCEENCQWIELGPEDHRRNIGRAVVDEPDEILRMIYGQLLRCLLKADMPLEDLFPVDFGEELYAEFPPSTQGAIGWGGTFQKYVDHLYTKGLIDTTPIGSLYLATTITMLPEYRFGVQGHTKYVFLHEAEENSYEISILAPAQSGCFDRILDIPVGSIKDLTIITDEYSQAASPIQIGLELRSGGKGHEFFLDSETVELNNVYLTFQPKHADHFKQELISKCPGLKLAESGKEAALNPTSSDNQKAPSQVSVSEELVVGVSSGNQKLEQPLWKLSQEPRLRTNSIQKTQTGQDDTQRSIVGEDELQNSVEAIVPNAQDKDDDGAIPQTTKELFKVTPPSKEPGPKSTVPPKGFNGVKPKAKPPIVQRDLRTKPSQASTQKPVAAPTTQTREKQKQTESVNKGKQKQSEQAATTTRRGSSSQAKKGAANSQPNMPPPKSKPNGKTRSTRSSQVTDDIVDSQVSEEPKPLSRSTQKAPVDSAKPKASLSKSAPSQSTDKSKSKPGIKETTKASQSQKVPEYQDFSDDFITDVDGMDASTPKITAAESQARKKTPAASTSNTQTNRLSGVAGTTSQKQKRYSLNPPTKSTPTAGDTYDLPVDDDEDEAPQKTKGKKSAKARKSAPKSTASAKPASKAGTKADPKKRQSAPAALGRPAATRHSQRAAAAKASEQLRGADKSDVEDAEVDEQPVPAKSQAAQKGKTNPARDATKTKVASKEAVDDKVAPATEEDEEMPPLPQPDEATHSLVQNNTIDRVDADNIYDTTPKKPTQKVIPQKLQDPVAEDMKERAKVSKAPGRNKRESAIETESAVEVSEEPAKVIKASNKSKRDSALEMASKLGDILGDMSDNPPETEPRNSVLRKELEQSAESMKRKPTNADNEEVPTGTVSTKSTGNRSISVITQSKTPFLDLCEDSDSSSSPAAEREQLDVSPPAPKQTTNFASQEKLKADDDKIFRKPPIPTYQRKTPIRANEGEPSTVESKLSEVVVDEEPEQGVATSAITNKAITEAEQDTPTESVRDDPDIGDIGRKRKAELTATTPPKRQRVDEGQNHAKEISPAASLPSSPPVRAPSSPPVRAQPSPKQPKKSRKSTENVNSPRRSPWLMNRARQATEALQQATSEATSAAKDPDRKPHLVSFGTKGALNQGISSAIKVRKDPSSPRNVSEEAAKPARKNRPSTKNVPEESPKPVREGKGEKKRKRERLDVVDESLPNKRQSVSPRETSVIDEYEDDDLPAFQDSPPAEAIKTKSTGDRRSTKPPTRPSSQTSRVDKNGSPMASSQEDHFGRLRERLAADRKGNKSQVSAPATVESPVAAHPRRLSEVFGPRVVLEKKPKARKSSPEETATRYVAHEKTVNGFYQEVATKQVIAPEKKVHDPFTEKGRKSSGFTERLMSGSSSEKQVEVSKQSERTTMEKRKAQDVEVTLPMHPRGASKVNRRPEPARRTQQVDGRERTRIEIESQASDPSMPSEMTMGTSYESQSSEPDRVPLSEKQTASAVWNVAIRPHYTNLHAAVQRIADEVILRLQGEEDRMGLLVEQYKEEGGKILSKLEQRHENERVAIVDALNHKRAEMVSIYSEAKELVLDTAKDLKENSTAQFEREWRKRQDAIRDEISEGRKVSELCGVGIRIGDEVRYGEI